MQDELDGMGLPVPVTIVGVNEAGYESDNSAMVMGRDLPWLQDTADVGLWSAWAPTYRDVVVLDGANRVAAVLNLTDNDLGSPAVYETLRGLFVDAAEAEAVGDP